MQELLRQLDQENRETLLGIYGDWQAYNRPGYVKNVNLFAMLSMTLLIPFDFLFFGQYGLMFSPYRVASLIFYGLLLGAFAQVQKLQSRGKGTILELLLVATPLQFNALYAFFLASNEGEYRAIILAANCLAAFFTTFYLHRFSRAQYIMSAGSITALGAFALFVPAARTELLLVLWTHIASALAMLFFRREFTLTMLERYKDLRNLMPSTIARFMVAAHGNAALEEVFKPTKRFAVCVVADWRNYQDLADSLDANEIAQLFEAFYNKVFEALDRHVPDGNYYADWSADELFGVFYTNDESSEALVLEQAINFATELATSISSHVRSKTGYKLVYDIGIACGIGLIGLQGPKRRKKTTITARFAGYAKRLETEAKLRRKTLSEPNDNPIVMMEDKVARFAVLHHLIEVVYLQHTKATSKNIAGQDIWAWQLPMREASQPPVNVENKAS